MFWFKNNFSAGGKNRIVRTSPNTSFDRKIVSGKKRSGSGGAKNHLAARILTWTSITIFVGVTGYVLFFSPVLSVSAIQVSGTEALNASDVSSAVNSAIEGKYLGMFNKSNIILANSGNIKKGLTDKFRKIESVEITKRFPDKLLVRVKERESALVFCSGDPCYVIDNNGRAYAPADFESNELGEQNLMILRDLRQKVIDMENISIDNSLLQFVADIRDRLKSDLNIEIKQEFSTPMLISGDLRVETVDGWAIYFSKDISIDKEIEMLKTILNNSIDKTRIADLDYVDLRLDNKVYYKLKN